MENKKDYRHLGAYGLLIENNKVLLIKKNSGPYHNKLDLPGGTIEKNERPIEALQREFKEEVGINIVESSLFDADSINFDWEYNNEILHVHHIGIFYIITKYEGKIKNVNIIDEVNDDSLGADFYDINKLSSEELSKIAIIELEKLEYSIK